MPGQTGATTLSTGTGGVSLNGDATVAANKSVIYAAGTGTTQVTLTSGGTTTGLLVSAWRRRRWARRAR